MSTQRAIEFTQSATIADAPKAVEKHVKSRVIDTLAATIAGYRQEGVSIVRDYATDRLGGQAVSAEATLLDGSGTSLTTEGATLANSIAANALDIDDGHREVKGHPAAVVIPPAIAAAEITDASIQEFLNAVFVGYEIAVRAGLAIHAIDGVYTGTGSWGAVGAAAATAQLFDLSTEQIAHALGIAEYHAPRTPIMRGVEQPGMTKDGIGWGAYAGIVATHLAKAGFTGSGTVFDESDVTDTLGEEFHVTSGYLKPYPCCRWAQPGVEAVLTLTSRYDFNPEDVQSIVIETFEEATHLQVRSPETPEEAQYSYPYPVAAALAHGRFTQVEHAVSARTDSNILELAERVDLSVDETLNARFPSKCLARVEIETGNDTYQSNVTPARGARDLPLSSETRLQKARRLVSPTLTSTVIDCTDKYLDDTQRPVTMLLDLWQA